MSILVLELRLRRGMLLEAALSLRFGQAVVWHRSCRCAPAVFLREQQALSSSCSDGLPEQKLDL
jgi:hypothetical protein